MIKKKWFAIFFLLGVIFFIVSGCVQKNPDQEKTVVRLWHPFSATSAIGRTLLDMTREFNEANPQWTIKPEGMGSYNVLKQKLWASLIAGNEPQLSLAYESWIMKFYRAGRIAILEDLLSPEELKDLQSDLFPVFLRSAVLEGKLISLPFNKSMPVLYYNKDLFLENGIHSPPETWQGFIDLCTRLTRDTDGDGVPEVYGTMSRANQTDFLNFLIQNGGSILSADGKTPLFNSPEGVEALKFFYGWKYLSGICDFYSGGNPYEYQNDFTSGRCAMIIGSCVSRFFMRSSLTFRLGMAALFGKKKKAAMVYGTNLVMFDSASLREKEAGLAFMKWFTSKEQTAEWSVRTAYLPVRMSALETDVLKQEFVREPDLKTTLEQLQYAFLEPKEESWLLGRSRLGDALNDALIDEDVLKAWKEYQASSGPQKETLKLELEQVMEDRYKEYLDHAAEEFVQDF